MSDRFNLVVPLRITPTTKRVSEYQPAAPDVHVGIGLSYRLLRRID
jgi:hypothetical protein